MTSDSIERISPAELNETLHDEQTQAQPPDGEILTFVVSSTGTRVLFDSGATHSIVSKAWLDQRGIIYTKRTKRDKDLPEKLVGVGKSVIHLIGTVVLALDDIPFPIYVCNEGPSFPIIGTPEMQHYGIVIDFARLKVTGANGKIRWDLQPQAEKLGIRQFETSIKSVKFIMYASGKTQPPQAEITQVAASSGKMGETDTVQAKPNPKDSEANKDQSQGHEQVQPTRDQEIESLIETTKPEIKIQLREVLKELTSKFSTAFNEKLGEPTKLPAYLHFSVELMSDVNTKHRKQNQFNVPAYPEGPQADEKALRETIDDLIKQGILERTCEPVCTSPVRIVPKHGKEGEPTKWRLVCNYQELNSITKKDAYPLPSLENIIQKARGRKFYAAMDMFKGFHLIPCTKEAAEKTGICTWYGVYKWKFMPMGAMNCPGVFQRMVDEVFKDLILKGDVAMYLDDTLVWADSIDELKGKLERILKRAEEFGLKYSKTKLQIGEEVTFGGFKLNEIGIQATKRSLEKIIRTNPPKTVRQMMALIGMIQYYAKFINPQAYYAAVEPLQDALAAAIKIQSRSRQSDQRI